MMNQFDVLSRAIDIVNKPKDAAMDRVIDDLNLPKPKSTRKPMAEQVERFCLQLFGRVGVADLERLLFLGEIVLRERRAALLDMQREEDEDGSLANYNSCER